MKNHRIFISIMMLVMLSTSSWAFANAIRQAGSRVIEGSYIVTFKKEADAPPLIQPPSKTKKDKTPFGEHSTGQSKNELATTLGTNGEIVSIFETINAVHIRMDAKEAERLSRDQRVLSIEKNMTLIAQTNQANPGWGLDRLDSSTPALNNTYSYTNTGAGRTIYILDSGLALSNPTVAAEFGGRASIIYDRNGSDGNDCEGHGTKVASVAGGNTMGVAKGATLIIAKITIGCSIESDLAAAINSFNWLATNALTGAIQKGTIVNYSSSLTNLDFNCTTPVLSPALENSIIAAHDAGIIVVVAAGNDGCNTANFSPANIPQAFVVGATSSFRLPGLDVLWTNSRKGWNISTFAPGREIPAMDKDGLPMIVSGTSISAPFIAGIFAVACQAAGTTYCSTRGTANLYTDLRNTGTLNTVTNYDGTTLTNATSRFIRQQW